MSDERIPDPSSGAGGGSRSKRRLDRLRAVLPPVPPPTEGRKPVRGITGALPGIVLLVFLVGVAALSILLLRPPAALPATAPAELFSGVRALAHVQALATAPHPVGSLQHEEAVAYLVAQLKQFGYEPEVQKTTGVNGGSVSTVENVLARLPGTAGGGKAVLLTAHYDTVASGPGAGDNTSGVATLLETARALKAGGQAPANDIIFLFDDGEELGYTGQSAFVNEHAWAKDVGLVLECDTYAATGPFRAGVGEDEEWAVSQFADAAPYPFASSFAIDVLDEPGSVSPMVAAGYRTMGVMTQPAWAYYHTALDNVANVDPDSLQHEGSYALSVARHFGDLDLATPRTGAAVYFNVVGRHFLVHYPNVWIYPFVALGAVLWAAAIFIGRRTRQLSLRGLLFGTLASLVVVVILSVLGYLLWRLVLVAYPQYRAGGFETGAGTYNGTYYWAAFMALGAGVVALLHSALRIRIRAEELAGGALFLMLVGAVLSGVAFPGASYAFTWSLVFSSLALGGWFLLRRLRRAHVWAIVWVALLSVPSVLIVASIVYPGGVTDLTVRGLWVQMLALGLLLGLLAVPLKVMSQPRRSWFPVLMGLVVVGFLVTGHLTSSYTQSRPLRDGIYYALSVDEGKGYWNGAFGTKIDTWTAQFLEKDGVEGDYFNIFPWEHEALSYQASAPLAELAAPQVQQLPTLGSEDFRLHVVVPPGTLGINFFTVPGPVTGLTYYLDWRPVQADGLLLYTAPPPEGFDLLVRDSGLDTLALRVVANSYGLPAIPGTTYTPRPDWIVTAWGESTNVAKTFTFKRQ